MSKDKKKKKKDKKSGKGSSTAGAAVKSLAQSPLVADVVAAALVATAAALKDSNKARRLASDAAEELGKLSKSGAEKGNALWDMALQIGRRSLETLMTDDAPKQPRSKPAAKPKATRKKAPKTGSR